MPPSRRQAVVAIGSGAVLGLAGCVAYGGDGGDSGDDRESNDTGGEAPNPLDLEFEPGEGDRDDEQGAGSGSPNGSIDPPTFPTEGPLQARLVGPDAAITVFERSDVEVGDPYARHDSYAVPVTVSEERSKAFLEAVQELELEENYRAYEIVVTVDGEEIWRSPIGAGLAAELDSGEWGRQFHIHAETEAEARRLRNALT